MSLWHGSSIDRNGLILYLDAVNPKSYPGSGTTIFDISGNDNHSSIQSGEFSTEGYFNSTGADPSTLVINTPHSTSLDQAMNKVTGGWTVEEVVLISDLTYPEAAAGSVISTKAYQTGSTGVDWNHGANYLDRIRLGATHNGGDVGNYDVDGDVPIDIEFQQLEKWIHRVIYWDRDTSTIGVYYNGKFQGSIDMSIVSGLTLYDGGGIQWGSLYGWQHDGSRALMRLYDSVLTQEQVKKNFEATRNRFGI